MSLFPGVDFSQRTRDRQCERACVHPHLPARFGITAEIFLHPGIVSLEARELLLVPAAFAERDRPSIQGLIDLFLIEAVRAACQRAFQSRPQCGRLFP